MTFRSNLILAIVGVGLVGMGALAPAPILAPRHEAAVAASTPTPSAVAVPVEPTPSVVPVPTPTEAPAVTVQPVTRPVAPPTPTAVITPASAARVDTSRYCTSGTYVQWKTPRAISTYLFNTASPTRVGDGFQAGETIAGCQRADRWTATVKGWVSPSDAP